MPNAIIYARFSTPKQEKGDTLERQLGDLQRYCAKEGWTVAETLVDKGRSAFTGKHLSVGNLGKLTTRILAGDVPTDCILVVEALDRLSREGHDTAVDWLKLVTRQGVRVAVTTTGKLYDKDSWKGDILDTIEILMKAKLANDESVLKSKRVGDAWKRKQANARTTIVTASCPTWLRVNHDRTGFIVIEEKAEIVRRVFNMVADGMGILRVAKSLNDEKISNWGRTGKGWSMTHIIRLVTGPAAEGDYVPYWNNSKKENGDRIVGYYPRIVDADLVARARAGMTSRRGTGGKYRNKWSNLFVGVVTCKTCGGKATMRRSPTNERGGRLGPGYMGCQNAMLGREGCTNKALFQYRPFEAAAVQHMLHLALDDGFFVKADETAGLSIALAEADKALTDITERRNNLFSLLEQVKDPGPLLKRYDALGDEWDKAELHRQEVERQLVLARGAVSPTEHLERVMSVANAITAEDDAVRLPARTRVHDAIRNIVDFVVMDPEDAYRGAPEKTYTMSLAGGAVAFKFANDGSLIAKVDAPLKAVQSGDEQMAVGLASGSRRGSAAVDAVVRRAAVEH